MSAKRELNVGETIKHISSDQVARHFTAGAQTYSLGAQLQHAVANALLNKIPKDQKNVGLDLGCGPGLFSQPLNKFASTVLSVDLSMAMLKKHPVQTNKIQGNSHQLPFKPNKLDWVFSSLMIQWCDFEQVTQQVYEGLKPGGKAYISTLVEGSLFELEQAWKAVDDDRHIHDYLSIETLVSKINRGQWQQVSIEQQQNVFWFDDVKGLAKELKMLGANYVKNRKNKGLMSKTKWQTMESEYRKRFFNTKRHAIPATYQVVLLELKK